MTMSYCVERKRKPDDYLTANVLYFRVDNTGTRTVFDGNGIGMAKPYEPDDWTAVLNVINCEFYQKKPGGKE